MFVKQFSQNFLHISEYNFFRRWQRSFFMEKYLNSLLMKNATEIVEQPKQIEKSYSDLLYESSLERMQNKIMNERAKHLITSVIPNYY